MKNDAAEDAIYIDSRKLDWYMLSIKDIAFYLGKEIRSVQRKSVRQQWPFFKEETKRGKPAHYFSLMLLPPDVQVPWANWNREKHQEAIEKEKSKKGGNPQLVPGPTKWYHAKEALNWKEQINYYQIALPKQYQRGPKQKIYDGVSSGLCSAARYILIKRFPELQHMPQPETIFNEIKQKAQKFDTEDAKDISRSSAKPELKKSKADKDLFVPLRPKRNFEEVANQIKELIFTGKLRPTEMLPSERDMAVQFNASRNTIREAYRVLEETGFIELKKGNTGGAQVCQMDGSLVTRSLYNLVQLDNISIEDITQARLTIELAILDDAFNMIGQPEIEKLETCLLNANAQIANNTPNTPSRRGHIVEFHLMIAENSRNKIFYYLLSSLVDLSAKFLEKYADNLTGEEQHLKDHWEILNALKSSDAARSKELFKNHILRMHYDISRQIQR